MCMFTGDDMKDSSSVIAYNTFLDEEYFFLFLQFLYISWKIANVVLNDASLSDVKHLEYRD